MFAGRPLFEQSGYAKWQRRTGDKGARRDTMTMYGVWRRIRISLVALVLELCYSVHVGQAGTFSMIHAGRSRHVNGRRDPARQRHCIG